MKIRTHNEQGSVLVIALVIGALLGLTLGSYMVWASNHNRAVARSVAWNRAIPVLEAGIEEAMSHLQSSPENRSKNGWGFNNGLYSKKRDLEADSYYEVSITTNRSPTIVSKGYVKAPLEKNGYICRTVQVVTTNRPLWIYGFATRLLVDMNGNNIQIDSYDSSNPAYSTLGKYDPAKRKDGGDVGTELGVTNSVAVGNADIWGKVYTAPGGTVTALANGSVGDLAWHSANMSGIKPGWHVQDMNADWPTVTDAPTSWLSPSGGKVGTDAYQYILTGGTFGVSQLNGGLYVAADSTLVIQDQLDISGSDAVVLAPGVTLKIYCYAATAKISGKGLINSDLIPTRFQYYGMPSNKSLQFSGGSTFSGAIYAPDADFKLGGGGGNAMDFTGSCMTKSLTLTGKFTGHYDESLKNLRTVGFTIVSWN